MYDSNVIPIVSCNDFIYIYLISNFWVGSGLHSIPSGAYAKFCCDYPCYEDIFQRASWCNQCLSDIYSVFPE